MGETRYFNEIDYLTKMAVSPSACHDHNYQDSTVFCFAAAANRLPAIQPAEPDMESVKYVIRNRFFVYRQGPGASNVSDEEINRIIDLKRRIFNRMGQLD